jgi:predicted DCC family thiol-disulfide oxidoreductase YuxK
MGTATVLYDEDCGFCRWSIARVRATRGLGSLTYAPIQGEAGDQLLANVPRGRRLASWHLVTDDGQIWSAGAAVPVLLRQARWGRLVAPVFETFPEATERAYDWVARHRAQLGALIGERACAVDIHATTATSG